MDSTPFHAKYLAHELTRRCASDQVDKLATALSDAQVDLNPHQVDAALFAFQSPFSRGAVLADEVGLGKTIEAGLLLAQRWAEGRRRLLVIGPANLRRQWAQELEDKFHLRPKILEAKSFNEAVRKGNLNPFQTDAIVVASYQFARSKEPYVRQVAWDLVVVDEAHRLRNVYKPSSKIANAIRQAIEPFSKVLLTATPLQNTLLELYGLVSIVDEHAFGGLESFKARFSRLNGDADFAELKDRLRPICKRTLRRHVTAYVRYTNRLALVQEFRPSDDEQCLYDLVSEYLQRPNLLSLPNGQRQLMTLVLRKLLASSTFAIAATLEGMAKRLEDAISRSEAVDSPPDETQTDWESIDELADEWDEDEGSAPKKEKRKLTTDEIVAARTEAAELRSFHELARSILANSKGAVLVQALRRGFDAAAEAARRGGSPTLQRKAVIFTESRRTQDYVVDLLEQSGFAGKVMLFNGTNTDAKSKAIHQAWQAKNAGTDRASGSPTADLRAALVEHFRDTAEILVATEAAAEGINLQFCNLVVNYDLPWNPQRIEQRIGRCHRYGQKHDVVVVNFVNLRNEADKRVHELLAEKFRLFEGVFGASDEILGVLNSGVDFEKRIVEIYQRCRTPQQIHAEFDALQRELETEIAAGQRDAREKLLDNFDQEVVERVRVDTKAALDRFEERLWRLTRHVLADDAEFDDERKSFLLRRNPFPGEPIHPGPYRMGKQTQDENTYRVGHPLAQRVLDWARAAPTPTCSVDFDLSHGRKRIAALDPFVGKSGWLACSNLTIQAGDEENHVQVTAITDDGRTLDEPVARRLFDLSGTVEADVAIPRAAELQLATAQAAGRGAVETEQQTRAGRFFQAEVEKLELWADDRKAVQRLKLEEFEQGRKELKKLMRTAATLPEKLDCQRRYRALEDELSDAWREFERARKEIDSQRDRLEEEMEAKLLRPSSSDRLFVLRWNLV